MPERSTTRTPRSTSAGTISAVIGSGSARKTASVSSPSRSTECGTNSPSQMRAYRGRDVCPVPDDIAVVSVTRGCCARIATSS